MNNDKYMRLWLMRHGDAGELAQNPKEERARPLTELGRQQAQAVADEMKRIGEWPRLMFVSVYQRTTDTGDLVGVTLERLPVVLTLLAPLMPLMPLLLQLLNDTSKVDVMLVGHHDNLEPLEQAMTGQKADMLACAEVRRFKVSRKDGSAVERWRLRPGQVGVTDTIAHSKGGFS